MVFEDIAISGKMRTRETLVLWNGVPTSPTGVIGALYVEGSFEELDSATSREYLSYHIRHTLAARNLDFDAFGSEEQKRMVRYAEELIADDGKTVEEDE